MSDASDVPIGVPGMRSEPELAPESYGARLAWERNRAGLTVNDIAARLRLHPNQVQAIEHEDLSRLPATAYVRGFIRSYARILNTNAVPLLEDFATRAAPAGSAVGSVARDGDPTVSSTADAHVWRHVVLVAALLLLIGLALVGWYTGLRVPAPAATVTLAPPLPSAPALPAKSEPTPASIAPVEVAEEAAPPSVAMREAASPMDPPPVLSLEFSGPCWFQVTTPDGRVLMSEQAVAGVVRQFNQAPPLTVVLGDANQVRVQVRGEAFDVAAFTRQNVARFSVN
jgi:cytoskeleton protein RodZ